MDPEPATHRPEHATSWPAADLLDPDRAGRLASNAATAAATHLNVPEATDGLRALYLALLGGAFGLCRAAAETHQLYAVQEYTPHMTGVQLLVCVLALDQKVYGVVNVEGEYAWTLTTPGPEQDRLRAAAGEIAGAPDAQRAGLALVTVSGGELGRLVRRRVHMTALGVALCRDHLPQRARDMAIDDADAKYGPSPFEYDRKDWPAR